MQLPSHDIAQWDFDSGYVLSYDSGDYTDFSNNRRHLSMHSFSSSMIYGMRFRTYSSTTLYDSIDSLRV